MDEVGPITAERLLSFVWRAAGRPLLYLEGWKRERPLVMVVDNYSVHVSRVVKEALPELTAAGISLFFLPPYSPELSDIEPVWQAVKHHEMPERSHSQVRDLKDAVEDALARKAGALLKAYAADQSEDQPQDHSEDQPMKSRTLSAIQKSAIQKTDNLLRMTA